MKYRREVGTLTLSGDAKCLPGFPAAHHVMSQSLDKHKVPAGQHPSAQKSFANGKYFHASHTDTESQSHIGGEKEPWAALIHPRQSSRV